jgi:hypothetical protein
MANITIEIARVLTYQLAEKIIKVGTDRYDGGTVTFTFNVAVSNGKIAVLDAATVIPDQTSTVTITIPKIFTTSDGL